VCELLLLENQFPVFRADFDFIAGFELTFEQAQGKQSIGRWIDSTPHPNPLPARGGEGTAFAWSIYFAVEIPFSAPKSVDKTGCSG
jgi:hypothetical protein